MRIQLQRPLKTLDRIGGARLTRGDDAEVIPRVGQRVRIIRCQLHHTLESFASSGVLILVQINAADPVECLGARWIIAKGLLEGGFCLVEISTLKKQRSHGKIIAGEFECEVRTGKRKSAGEALGISLRSSLKILFDVLRVDWSLVDLDDAARRIDQERGWKAEIAVAVEYLAIEKVVNRNYIVGCEKNRE